MTSAQFALFALAVGALIGAGTVLLVVWAYRARAQAMEQVSSTIPAGITAMLASMDDAACVLDSSGMVAAASLAAERLGIRVGSVLENTELRQLVRAVRGTGSTSTDTLRLSGGASLDPRLVSARAASVTPKLTLLIIRDVTERERLEQMRTDFVANTSHELKTPVASVSLLAEAIETAADDPEQVRYFASRISAETARLGQLTGRILSLSRLQAADGLGAVEAVSIDEVIAASIEAHAVQADSAQVQLTRGGDRGLWVQGDVQILIEAVGNLIANAIVYSPKGSKVGVGVKRDGDVVEIAVSDRGIGIAEADRDRVFERFYRADEARSRSTGGTGLGLSIVKHAIQRHGGEVRLWSRPGHGSTFTLRLPRIDAEQPAHSKKKSKRKSKKKAAAKDTRPRATTEDGESA